MKWTILAVMCSLAAASAVRGDVSLSIIEYRALKSVGQVRMTRGFVHEPAIQGRVQAHRSAFEKEGIILVDVASERRVEREEKIGAHSIRTVISLQPPMGHGYRGGMSTAHVLVTVDGQRRVDCPYDGGNIEISDLSILPLDGFISVRATVGGASVDALMPLRGDEAMTASWLMAKASGR